MSILDQKKKIFGNIAALRTLNDGFPKLKLNSSFKSINNGGNSILFLTDLIKALIGYEALVSNVTDILTYSLADIEKEIKLALKQELKSIVSCGVNPSIPTWMKSSGTGITIEVKKIDYTDQLRVDPTSIPGKLLYSDITPNLSDSTDLNTFLYSTIQNDTITQIWGSNSPLNTNILNITFNANGNGTNPNNTINIKANSNYDNKTLTDLNNDFIDSLTLFNTENLINRIIDAIFGTISFNLNKTTKQIQNEEKINTIIEKIINSTTNTIDDSYFTFSNEELYIHEQSADYKKNGVKKLECCNKISASIPIELISNFNNQLSGTTTLIEKKEVITRNLDQIGNQATTNSDNPSDHKTIKLNFIQDIINNLIRAIVGVVISPKIIIIFLTNFKIIYGPNAEFSDAIDFIKKNKVLFNNLSKRVSTIIVKKLLSIALKTITEMVATAAAKQQIEKSKSQLSQLLSLVGVPQESIRLIKGLL